MILGGTTEARELGFALCHRELVTTISLAGRTAAPAAQPVPVRRGGFGGADGLAEYLRAQRVDFLIDATHPYAETISANAVQAASRTNTPILALRRPPWTAVDGDTWIDVSDAQAASFCIDAVVAKNSGGEATYSKIAAARLLGIPVFMFSRPPVAQCPSVGTVAEAVAWLDHAAGLAVPRGV